jgi:hypothetical protein
MCRIANRWCGEPLFISLVKPFRSASLPSLPLDWLLVAGNQLLRTALRGENSVAAYFMFLRRRSDLTLANALYYAINSLTSATTICGLLHLLFYTFLVSQYWFRHCSVLTSNHWILSTISSQILPLHQPISLGLLSFLNSLVFHSCLNPSSPLCSRSTADAQKVKL